LGLYIAAIELLVHDAGERFQASGCDRGARMSLDRDPIEGSLNDRALHLQRLDSLLQLLVQFDDSVFDCRIKALELFVLLDQLGFECQAPILNGTFLDALSINESFEYVGEPSGV